MAFGAKIKLSVDQSNSASFAKDIQKFVNAATRETPITLKKFKVDLSNKAELISSIQRELDSSELTVKIKQFDTSGAVQKLRNDISNMMKGLTIGGMTASFNGNLTSGLSGAVTVEKEFTNAANEAAASAARQSAAMKELSQIEKSLRASYGKVQNVTNVDEATQLQERYRQLMTDVEKMRNGASVVSDESLANLSQEAALLSQNTASVLEYQKAQANAGAVAAKASQQRQSAAMKDLAVQQRVANLQLQIQNYMNQNSAAVKAYRNQFDNLLSTLSRTDLTEEMVGEARLSFTKLRAEAKETGNVGSSLFQRLKKGWEKFGGWAIVTGSLTKGIQSIKKMISSVRELDTAMTELRKVTDLSEEDYANYMDRATDTAKNIGATVSDTINATADYARLGYDINQSAEMAEAALVYKNVGDGIDDISEATESLISTMKAFGDGTYSAMEIVDKFNEVGNNFAISSEGIGVALQKSAAAMAAGGNTLEESIGLVVGMNSVIQNPDQAGTALRSLSMFLRAAKADAEAAGESTEGMANSVSELRDDILRLTNNKVDIMIDDKSFKSTFQIMKELSEIWDDLYDVDQAGILKLIAGKRNANTASSLLKNFKDAEAAAATAANASGSAMAENDKYLDSINGKIERFKASVEDLSQTMISSDFLKAVIDGANGAVTALDGLAETFGSLPVMATAAASAFSLFKNKGKIYAHPPKMAA